MSIDRFVDNLMRDAKRASVNRRRLQKLKYPAYFEIFDSPVKLNKKGKNIYVEISYHENATEPLEVIGEGLQIPEKEFNRLLRQYKRWRRKRIK